MTRKGKPMTKKETHLGKAADLRKQAEAEEIQDALKYAESIVETMREPLVVLNSDLKIITANHSFYDTFKVMPEETIGNFIYDLGNRQWDIPKLRVLFEDILPHDTVFNGYEVEHDFLNIGHKVIMLNARQIFRKNIGSHIILLAMEDMSLAVGRLSKKFKHAEGWRRHLHLGYCSPEADPLAEALGKNYLVNKAYERSLQTGL